MSDARAIQDAHDEWLAAKVARGDVDNGFPGDRERFYADDDDLWERIEQLQEARYDPRLHPRDRLGRWRDVPHLIQTLLPNAHLVGGSVRDEVMGRPVKDHDFLAPGMGHAELRSALEPHGRVDDLEVDGRKVGVRFHPSDPVPGAPLTGIEIAPPRTERSTGPGRHDFEIVADASVPIEEDARRRDFTVNAIAKAPDGTLVDPLGGAQDARDGVLRVIGATAFRDDGLRIARGLRFVSTHGLTPDARTEDQMREWARRIEQVSGERLRDELSKLLMGSDPAKALRVARDTGVLERMIPELGDALHFEQKSPYHTMTLDEHTFSAVQAAADSGAPLEVRLATLLHDSGKPGSMWEDETGRRRYYANEELGKESHEHIGARLTRSALERLRYPREIQDTVTGIVREHMFQDHKKLKGGTVRERDRLAARKFLYRLAKRYGKDDAREIGSLTARHKMADVRGKEEEESDVMAGEAEAARAWETLLNTDVGPFHVSHLNINGDDLTAMGGKPGPAYGQVLDSLLHQVMGQPDLNNDREWLRRQAAKGLGIKIDKPESNLQFEGPFKFGAGEHMIVLRDPEADDPGWDRAVAKGYVQPPEQRGSVAQLGFSVHPPTPEKRGEIEVRLALTSPEHRKKGYGVALFKKLAEHYPPSEWDYTAHSTSEGGEGLLRAVMRAGILPSKKLVTTDETFRGRKVLRYELREADYIEGLHPRDRRGQWRSKLGKSYAEAAKIAGESYAGKMMRDLNKALPQFREWAAKPRAGSYEDDNFNIAGVNAYKWEHDTGTDRIGFSSNLIDGPEGRPPGVEVGEVEQAEEKLRALVEKAADTRHEVLRKGMRGIVAPNTGKLRAAYEEAERAMTANESNEKYDALRTRWGIPDHVVMIDEKGYGKQHGIRDVMVTAAREPHAHLTRVNALALQVAADPRFAAADEKRGERLKPGTDHATANSTAALFRHEWAHSLWEDMPEAQRREFIEMTPGWDEIASGLTKYAAGDEADRADYAKRVSTPEGYYTETFAEAVALTTDPLYVPDEWPEWVQKAGKWIEELSP